MTKPNLKRNKGVSINEFPENYCVLDLETTGLSTEYNEIIEIGILKVRNNNIVDQYQSLIQPTPFYYEDEVGKLNYVDLFTEALTGITNEMLEVAPKFEEKSKEIKAFIDSDIILGHNVNFDINFLYDAFFKSNNFELSNNFFDLLKISRRALKDIHHHRLKDLAEYFNYQYKPHRALEDCIATYDITNLLKTYVAENGISIELPKRKRNSNGKYSKTLNLTELKSQVDDIDTENYFYGKNICFTGKLENFQRKDAAQICVNLGANCQNRVTQKTNLLVLGNLDLSPLVKNGKSEKLKRAEKLKLEGRDIEIMDENTFLETLEF